MSKINSVNDLILYWGEKEILPKKEIIQEGTNSQTIWKTTDSEYKTNSKQVIIRAILEWFLSIIVNKMKRKMPSFISSIGIITSSNINLDNFRTTVKQNLDSFASLLYEDVQGQTFKQWILTEKNEAKIIKVILIIVFSLQKAREKILFSHGNLTTENILIKKKSCKYIFKIGSLIYEIKSDVTPVIINYSKSSVSYKHFKVSLNDVFVIVPPGQDLFTLLSDVLMIRKFSFSEFINFYGKDQVQKDPLQWFNWVSLHYPGQVKDLVKISPRLLFPFRENTLHLSSMGKGILRLCHSAVFKKALNLKYDNIDILSDQKLIEMYQQDLLLEVKSDYENLVFRLKKISNLIYFLRLAFTINFKELNFNFPLSKVFEIKRDLVDKINSISEEMNLNLYKNSLEPETILFFNTNFGYISPWLNEFEG
jgi:hypothetical protein